MKATSPAAATDPLSLLKVLAEECWSVIVPTDAADKAGRVVGPPQGRHHLSSDVLVAAVTLGPIEPLVILCANVLA